MNHFDSSSINNELGIDSLPVQAENRIKEVRQLLKNMDNKQLEEYLPKILKEFCNPISEMLQDNDRRQFAVESWEPWYKSVVVRVKNMIELLNAGEDLSMDPLDKLPHDKFVRKVNSFYQKI